MIAYLDCYSGASGDMILGAMIDAGLKVSDLRRQLKRLPLSGWEISTQRVQRCALPATKFRVKSPKAHHTVLRSPTKIIRLIQRSRLSTKVRHNAIGIFSRLAEAEAKVHRTGSRHVFLHELGSIDSIIDIVGACVGLELLEVDELYTSPIPLTHGSIHTHHGQLPVPAPVTLELLRGCPVRYLDIDRELVTPTAAAIITTLSKCVGTVPPFILESCGYGAGEVDLPYRPNLTRIILGRAIFTPTRDQVWVLETNLDDISGQIAGYLYERLLNAGALDVYLTPIQAKKSRPGVKLTLLAPLEKVDLLEQIVFNETSTFGIRRYLAERTKLERKQRIIKTKYGAVRVKLGFLGGRLLRVSPEYEDCRRVASNSKVPLTKVFQEALALSYL
jgi:hypothetical protein